MQLDHMTTNLLILGGLGAAVLFVIVMTIKDSLRKKRTAERGADPSRPVPQRKRLYESKESIPKLPRNETLYQILKNGTLSSNMINFQLNYVLDEVASLMRKDLHSGGVELLFDIEDGLPNELIGSPKRLSRILINLLENAIRFSDEGVVVLKIRRIKGDGVNCRLQFFVIDEGRGMDAEQLKELMIDPAERMIDGKMPLGYYVAHALVRAEGGDIAVKSRVGEGTTVSFDLKLKVPQKHAPLKVYTPTKECRSLKVAVLARHDKTGELMKRYMSKYVREVMTLTTQEQLSDVEWLDGYEMVIIDHMLIDTAAAHTLKAKGIWLIAMHSILEPVEVGTPTHYAADYLLSIPFTSAHIVEMLTVFYGEESETEEPASATERKGGIFDTFVSDAEIPVETNVSKKDFNIFIGSKLLIVEDNPINQRVIKGLLGDSGMHLYFAENGLEALDVLEEDGPFDLVLMDINMPVLDGIETTRRIRTRSQYDNMPVVAFTGLNLQDQIDRMKEAGMNAHMAKPLNIGRFFSVFNHFLPKNGQLAS